MLIDNFNWANMPPVAINKVYKMHARFRFVFIIFSFLIFGLLGCAESEQRQVIRIGHSLNPTHTVHKAMLVMRDELERLSGNTMTIQIYPSGQLGTERELIELLQIGSLGMTKVSASPLEGFVPEMKIFNLPYLFRDHEHFLQVLDSPVGQSLLEAVRPARMMGLGYYDAGSRSFYTTQKQVFTPADLDGMKIRVQESQMAMQMIKSLGGSPTPIAWGELYTALQQGVVDGAENNPPSYFLSRHFEVAPYFTIDEHTAVPDIMLISNYVWDQLTPEQQSWLRKSMQVSVDFQREQWRLDTIDALQKVEAGGAKIHYVDKQAFQEEVADFVSQFAGTSIGQLIEKIQEVGRD
jgi:tripartite ATP-independent transporter DctP family solute receptor